MARLRRELGRLDLAGDYLSVTSDPTSWVRPGGFESSAGVLMTAHVLRQVEKEDWPGLAVHLRTRQRWGEAVRRGLESARSHFSQPCVAKYSKEHECSRTAVALRPRVVVRIDSVLKRGTQLGNELCRAVPELQAELGPDCEAIATAYLFAFSWVFGRSDLLG